MAEMAVMQDKNDQRTASADGNSLAISYPSRDMGIESSDVYDYIQKPWFTRQLDLIQSGMKSTNELPMTKLNYHRTHKGP